MPRKRKRRVFELARDGPAIDAAMRRATLKAVAERRALGLPIVAIDEPKRSVTATRLTPKRKRSVSELARDARGIERAMKRAVARAIAERRALGLPIVALDEPKRTATAPARRRRPRRAA